MTKLRGRIIEVGELDGALQFVGAIAGQEDDGSMRAYDVYMI